MAMVARGMSADDIDKLLGKTNDDGKPAKDPLQSLANTRRTAIVLISSWHRGWLSFSGAGVDCE